MPIHKLKLSLCENACYLGKESELYGGKIKQIVPFKVVRKTPKSRFIRRKFIKNFFGKHAREPLGIAFFAILHLLSSLKGIE